MLLVIHDSNLRKVAFIDNEKQDTLNYYDDVWTRYLYTGSSTFEFTVFKKAIKSDTASHKTYNYLNEKAFVSFKYHGKSYVFSVMTVEEDERTIKCYCENLNLELINEYANPYKASEPMTFAEYCTAMNLLNFSHLTIGINEISDKKRTLEWEGQDTNLARLLSLANKFDAEIDFETELNFDSTIKSFKVNVYHENDDTHQGVGKIRNDIQLTYKKNIKSIKRKIDKTEIFTMVRPTGKGKSQDIRNKNSETAVTIDGLEEWSEKNADGVREFYQKGDALYAPLAAQMYPSTFTTETQKDQWIRKDLSVDSDNPSTVRAEGIKALKRNAYPAITYDIDGFIDVNIGDTVKIQDEGFTPMLIVEARVSDQKISFSNPQSNKTTFANIKALKSKISGNLQDAFNRLLEESQPYLIKLSTDNGVIFKNQSGESLVTGALFRGNKPITTNVTWRWSLDGQVKTGASFLVNGSKINNVSTLTVAAYVGDKEVAIDEITFVNVSDGENGPAGKSGIDGKTSYFHIAYANIWAVANEFENFTLSTPTVVRFGTGDNWVYKSLQTGTHSATVATFGSDPAVGQGKRVEGFSGFSTSETTGRKYFGTYSDFTSEPSSDISKYTWTLVKGEKGDTGARGLQGEQGIPGVAGRDGRTQYTHIAYADNATGGGFSQNATNKAYIGMYVDFDATDSRNPTDYRWTKWRGEDGAQGVPGPKGQDGRTPYVHFAYANSADGRTDFSLTNTGNKRYIGTYTDFNENDSTDPTKYKWVDMVGSVEVSYRNLAIGSSNQWNDFQPITRNSDWQVNLYTLKYGDETGIYAGSTINLFVYISADGLNYSNNSTGTIKLQGAIYDKNNNRTWTNWDLFHPFYNKWSQTLYSGDNYHVIKISTTVSKESYDNINGFDILFRLDNAQSGKFHWRGLMITTGTAFPAHWTKPIEDTQAEISLSQEQINALNESADLLRTEMDAKASIATVDEYIKTFNDFVKSNAESQIRSENDLIAASQRLEKISTDFGNLAERWDFIDSYMKSSNEGLIIGKTDGSSSMLFNPNGRISMFSAGKEVMYISQGVIHIENGIFSKTIQVGRFRTEQYHLNADMNVIRYVG